MSHTYATQKQTTRLHGRQAGNRWCRAATCTADPGVPTHRCTNNTATRPDASLRLGLWIGLLPSRSLLWQPTPGALCQLAHHTNRRQQRHSFTTVRRRVMGYGSQKEQALRHRVGATTGSRRRSRDRRHARRQRACPPHTLSLKSQQASLPAH